jgi:hypothetical protein
MNQFHVGQKVVCIGRFVAEGYCEEVLPTKGEVYTIRDLVFYQGHAGVLLEEIRNPPRLYNMGEAHGVCECAFAARQFRPVKTTNIDVFLKMLKPEPVDA